MNHLHIQSDSSIKDALKQLSKGGEKCLVVVDETAVFQGTLSDGDIRKALLKGKNIRATIKGIYQRNSTYLRQGQFTNKDVRNIFIKKNFDLIPVINKTGKIAEILTWVEAFKNNEERTVPTLSMPVVIMAGGRGTRLEPFTKILPKPLIPVHDKPIIEHIIEKFTVLGCSDFCITVSYKSKILMAYFEELEPKYNLRFVEEQEPLGTAGSLCLLRGQLHQPFVVTNCDIIIKADYASLYDFHMKGGYDITLIASAKEYVIPYGTCELNSDGHLIQINEKPKFDFLINTGLYILNPNVLELVPENKFYNMTDLIEDAKNKGKKVGVFPIDDDAWIDVGQWAEYQKSIKNL